VVRADKFLVEHGYYESRARAQSAIKAGCVFVDGAKLKKPSDKIAVDAIIEARSEHPWVSRGGVKLAHALDEFGVSPRGKTCLDIGASTGGFSEVLLHRGGALVYAVDVGRDQLHSRLRGDARIISMEGMDARQLTRDQFDEMPDFIVCDASFISIEKVLDTVLDIMPAHATLIALVKPQFQVGKSGLGKGGIVRDKSLAEQALSDIAGWLKAKGWTVKQFCDSPIRGGSGNREYLLGR